MKKITSKTVDLVLTLTALSLLSNACYIKIAHTDLLLLFGLLALFIKVVFALDKGLFPNAVEHPIFGALYKRKTKIATLGISTLFCGIILEIVLRNSYDSFPQTIANELAHGYRSRGSGIHIFNEQLKMKEMKANYERDLYFNGYFWRHKTDSRGFRNEQQIDNADIVLLGDSMIYGHGVNAKSTVASHLQNITDKIIYNMGQQGACIHEEYQLLLNDVADLNPDCVFIFFLNNDISDIAAHLSKSEQETFITTPVNDFETPYISSTQEKRKSLLQPLDDMFRESYVFRLWIMLPAILTQSGHFSLYSKNDYDRPSHAGILEFPISLLSVISSGQNKALRNAGFLRDYFQQEPFSSNPDMITAMEFQLHALKKIRMLCELRHFKWAFNYIYTDRPYDGVFEEILSTFCERERIPYFNLKRAYSTHGSSILFLKGDGHFSDAGARITATAIKEHFNL